MIFPNKVSTFKDSTIYTAFKLLEHLEKENLEITLLFKKISRTQDLSNFIDALCLLYLLEKIKLENGVLIYVK